MNVPVRERISICARMFAVSVSNTSDTHKSPFSTNREQTSGTEFSGGNVMQVVLISLLYFQRVHFYFYFPFMLRDTCFPL